MSGAAARTGKFKEGKNECLLEITVNRIHINEWEIRQCGVNACIVRWKIVVNNRNLVENIISSHIDNSDNI